MVSILLHKGTGRKMFARYTETMVREGCFHMGEGLRWEAVR